MDPVASTVSLAAIVSQAQAATATQFSLGVLKRVLAMEASTGAQLARMVDDSGGVDLYA